MTSYMTLSVTPSKAKKMEIFFLSVRFGEAFFSIEFASFEQTERQQCFTLNYRLAAAPLASRGIIMQCKVV